MWPHPAPGLSPHTSFPWSQALPAPSPHQVSADNGVFFGKPSRPKSKMMSFFLNFKTRRR